MPKPRPLMVADILTLTAATAVGIAGTRHAWGPCRFSWFWGLDEGWSAGATLRRLTVLVVLLLPGLAAGTAAVMVARFTPPRPSRRRIALQPGSAACGAALLVLTAEAICQAATLLHMEASQGHLGVTWRMSGFAKWFHMHVLFMASHSVSVAVIAAWALLSLSRRGRPEPGWIDRTGRALGVCWIAIALLVWINKYFLDGRNPVALF